jgi:hypothetical protein
VCDDDDDDDESSCVESEGEVECWDNTTPWCHHPMEGIATSVTASAKRQNLDRLAEDKACNEVDLARQKVASKRHQVIEMPDDEIAAIEMSLASIWTQTMQSNVPHMCLALFSSQVDGIASVH